MIPERWATMDGYGHTTDGHIASYRSREHLVRRLGHRFAAHCDRGRTRKGRRLRAGAARRKRRLSAAHGPGSMKPIDVLTKPERRDTPFPSRANNIGGRAFG